MKQTLKISIARGGCRFATPLYLGGDYTLAFDGNRSDEATSILFVKPKSDDATKADTMNALAQSTKDETSGEITLKLNKQALLDWFTDCGECDVDGYVDAHCYVFDAGGVILADSDVTIEYKPVQFVVDSTGFDDWSKLDDRIAAVEEQAKNHESVIEGLDSEIATLKETDEKNLAEAKKDATEKADTALNNAISYAETIKMQLAKMQYVKCDEESTEKQEIYHRVFLTKNEDGEHVLTVDENPSSIEGTDPGTAKYVYTDTNQTIIGQKTFREKVTIDGANGGSILVPTKDVNDNSMAAASTAFVQARLEKFDEAFADWWSEQLLGNIEWHGQHTFVTQIKANGGVKGDVTGNVKGNVEATDVKTVNAVATNIDADTLDVTGAETHSGTEIHSGSVTLKNVNGPTDFNCDLTTMSSTQGIPASYVWDVLRMFFIFTAGNWAHGTASSESKATSTTKVEWRSISSNNSYMNVWATQILNYCFYDQSNLYNVYFPNVTFVGAYAFYNNYNLIVISNFFGRSGFYSLVSAGEKAFWNCNNIATTTNGALNRTLFPSLEFADMQCFEDCSNVTSVDLPRLMRASFKSFYALNSNLTSFSMGSGVREDEFPAVDNALTNWLETNWATLKQLESTTGNGVIATLANYYESIGGQPYFYFDGYCWYKDKLTNVQLHSAQIVGDCAFAHCANITSLYLPKALVLGSDAFYHLGWATNNYIAVIDTLSLPECLFIGMNCFGSDTNDTHVSPARVVNAPELLYVANRAFMMAFSLVTFNAPKVKRIGAQAFWGCPQLRETIPDTGIVAFDRCLEIGPEAFHGRSSHMTFTKASFASCTKIGYSAFYDTPNLTDLYLTSMDATDVVNKKAQTGDDAGINNWGLSTSTVVHCAYGQNVIYRDGVWQKQ